MRAALERASNAEAPTRIIAAGGDGTVHEVINGLRDGGLAESPEAVLLGILPFGTANDFARGLGIPVDDLDASAKWVAGSSTRRIDLGQADDRLFANMITGGPSAGGADDMPSPLKAVIGDWAYTLGGVAGAFLTDPPVVAFHADSIGWHGPIFGFALGNGSQAGGGYRFCPGANLEDSLLDLLIVPYVELDQLAELIHDGIRIQQGQTPYFAIQERVARLEIHAETPLRINLDGEPETITHLTASIAPYRINLLAPNSDAE